MTISDKTPVSEIAALVPSSIRVFERFGIDFCCGGEKPLGVACQDRQLSFDEVRRAIEASAAEGCPSDRDWALEPLPALIDHIVTVYHARLRDQMPRLEQMAARVARVHGAKAPRLLGRLEAIVGELSADLREHMLKEERVLFPAIRALDSGHAPALPVPLDSPIRVMMREHDAAGDLLAELRRITEGYTPSDWACATSRALYAGLEELERDMHVHVHLENNILFPAALRQPALAITH